MNEFYDHRKSNAHVILFPQSLFIHPPTTHILCYNGISLTENLIQRLENSTGCENRVSQERRNFRTNVHNRSAYRISEGQCTRVRELLRPDAHLWDAHCNGSRVAGGAPLVPVPLSRRWVPPRPPIDLPGGMPGGNI